MTAKRNVIISGVVAAVVAVALITAAILSPGLLGSSSTTNPPGTGTLAVLLTDPPTVPNGVTAVYATYSDLAVHVAGAGNQSGWYDLKATGTINLMSVINTTQTISSSAIPSGEYNALRFNISSATVTYNGKSYPALIVEDYGSGESLYVPISGGIVEVNGSTSAAAVLDLTPTILLLGSPSSPTFAFMGAAKAYTMPANSTQKGEFHVGDKEKLQGQGWWDQIMDNTHFQITSASLSSNSLSVTVKNTGNTSIVFRMIGVTSTTSQTGGSDWRESTDASVGATTAVFVVQSTTSMNLLNASNGYGALQMVAAGGYLLPPSASVTFSYSGPITIGLLTHISIGMVQGDHGNDQGSQHMTASGQTQTIVSGQSYVITVRGEGLQAQTLVTAS
jgi:hypothetical protein